MDDLLEQFVLEAREQVQQAAADLAELERDPGDRDRVDSAFRAIHTLKGSSGLFAFAPMTSALHAAEDLIGALREERLTDTAAAHHALLACIDAVDVWVETVARTERLPDDAEIRSRTLIGALRTAASGAAAPPHMSAPEPEAPVLDWVAALQARDAARQGISAFRFAPRGDSYFMGDDPVAVVRAVPDLVVLDVSAAGAADDGYDPFSCTLVFQGLSAAPTASVHQALRFVADQAIVLEAPAPAIAPAPQAAPDTAGRTLRIEAARIDAIADLVGELFVAKSRLSHVADEVALSAPAVARALAASQAEIERLVGSMHHAVMAARITPLDGVFRRLPRLLRETARQLGKTIRLEMEGTETQADRTIADALFEPLMHVLRNAADHGIELAEARERAGKPREGRIVLRARSEGRQVVITVTDDGAGIDPTALRRSVHMRGLASEAALAAASDDAVLQYLFMPGFSTASKVTDVSGRGVGLDAVRMALQALGGRVSIAGSPGQGTCVSIVVPQAVSVTTILLVDAGGQTYGVPLQTIAETARVPRAHVMPAASGSAFVLRDRTVPLVRLSDLLGLPAADGEADARVLVVDDGGDRFGVKVDGLGARLDVVLRPLAGLLAGLPGLRGSASLGDGRVLLVLDLPELVR